GTSDARTDVYAVGVLLHEMLTGAQPFTGATPIQVAYQHVHTDIPAPSNRVDWLPVEVDELVQALAARDPADRPADAAAAQKLVRRLQGTLDAETLARRADVAPSITLPQATAATNGSTGTGTSDEPADDVDASGAAVGEATATTDDADITQALHVGNGRPAPSWREDTAERGGSRTMALRIGSGLDPEDDDAPPPHRSRRRPILLALGILVLLAVIGGAGWWYMSSGPGAYTTVPANLTGAPLTAAEQVLRAAGLKDTPVEVFDPVVPKGTVVKASPTEGSRILKKGTVELSVSKGPEMLPVPADLVGKATADVTAALTQAGFIPEPTHSFDDAMPADHVLALSHAGGEILARDSKITVTISDGPAPVKIFSVLGATKEVAVKQLTDAGLAVDAEATAYSETYPAGQVMAQTPDPGTDGHRRDKVTLTVSLGPPLVQMPDLFGKRYSDAKDILTGLGLNARRENLYGGALGFVRSQGVAAGEMVPKGTTITLSVV
ncbi:MAG TPA: PASTA domain-containing protein, partial [Propionicimonas sp.]